MTLGKSARFWTFFISLLVFCGSPKASFIQNFNTSASGSPDTIEAFIVSDTGSGPFENDGMTFHPVNDSGWNASLINPKYSKAIGPDDSSFNMVFHFLGDSTKAVTIDLLFWDDGSLTFGMKWIYNNGPGGVQNGINFLDDPTGNTYDRSSVPEPTTLALMGLGLAGIGYRRKRNKIAA